MIHPTLPLAGGGDHSETTETRPDGATRTLTNIAPGFETRQDRDSAQMKQFSLEIRIVGVQHALPSGSQDYVRLVDDVSGGCASGGPT